MNLPRQPLVIRVPNPASECSFRLSTPPAPEPETIYVSDNNPVRPIHLIVKDIVQDNKYSIKNVNSRTLAVVLAGSLYRDALLREFDEKNILYCVEPKVKRSFIAGMLNINEQRPFHPGMLNINEQRPFHPGMLNINEQRPFHPGMLNINEQRSFQPNTFKPIPKFLARPADVPVFSARKDFGRSRSLTPIFEIPGFMTQNRKPVPTEPTRVPCSELPRFLRLDEYLAANTTCERVPVETIPGGRQTGCSKFFCMTCPLKVTPCQALRKIFRRSTQESVEDPISRDIDPGEGTSRGPQGYRRTYVRERTIPPRFPGSNRRGKPHQNEFIELTSANVTVHTPAENPQAIFHQSNV